MGHGSWIVSSIRYANIGIAVGIAVIVLGVLLFRGEGEGALQAVALVGFVAGGGVYLFLDERAARRQERRSQ